MDYISLNCTDYNYGIFIRDLCHYRDSCDPHILIATEIVQLIEYLCTIYEYYLFIIVVVVYSGVMLELPTAMHTGILKRNT